MNTFSRSCRELTILSAGTLPGGTRTRPVIACLRSEVSVYSTMETSFQTEALREKFRLSDHGE